MFLHWDGIGIFVALVLAGMLRPVTPGCALCCLLARACFVVVFVVVVVCFFFFVFVFCFCFFFFFFFVFFFFFFFYCDGRSLYSCTAMHVCGFYIGSSRMFAL